MCVAGDVRVGRAVLLTCPCLDSPLVLTMRPGVSAKRSNISGDGTVEAHVGQPAEVVLRLMMHNHLPGMLA